MAMAKKGKTKSWKKKQEELAIVKPHEPDILTKGTRIGMIVVGYCLFIIGSLSALIVGYAGQHKKGSSEVIIIGWVLVIVHAMFFSLLVINPAVVGIRPIKVIYEILIIYPFLCFIPGFIGYKKWWGNTFRITGLVLAIPHYLALATIANPGVVWDNAKANEIITKANVRIIQKQLERYSQQNDGIYPPDITSMVQSGFIKAIPNNPFITPQAPMQGISFGQTPFEGNFTYVPVNIDGRISAYYLLGYGAATNAGEDVDKDGMPDHVIVVLDGVGVSIKMTVEQIQKLVERVPSIDKLLKKAN